jgi:hypothetical protein
MTTKAKKTTKFLGTFDYMYHNNVADPEVRYNGKTLSYYSVLDSLDACFNDKASEFNNDWDAYLNSSDAVIDVRACFACYPAKYDWKNKNNKRR